MTAKLKLWTTGIHGYTVAATSRPKAAGLLFAATEDAMEAEDFVPADGIIPDPLTLYVEGEGSVTKTHAEWIKARGAGLLGAAR